MALTTETEHNPATVTFRSVPIALGAEASGVDTACHDYDVMAEAWDLIEDLLGGTRSMRAARQKWLPMEDREPLASYETRLNGSILFNGFRDTIDRLTAKPFSEPITELEVDQLDPRLQKILRGVNGTSQDITAFAKSIFKNSCTYGKSHILVDFPATGGNLTVEEETKRGVRPVFIEITAPQVIRWSKGISETGEEELTEFVYRMCFTRRAPLSFQEEYIEQVRIITKTEWFEFERTVTSPQEKFTLKRTGPHTFGAVPVITCYFSKTGFMTADVPLEDLAWLNLAHWQSDSSQRNILRFARFAILFLKGLNDGDLGEDEENSQLTLGPNTFIKSTSAEADAKFVEHNGASIKAGRDDLQDLEQRMEVMGQQPMMQRSSRTTATSKIIDDTRSSSDIMTWIRAVENAINEAMIMAAKWIKVPLPPKFRLDIFDEFTLSYNVSEDVQNLTRLAEEGFMSARALLIELKRRGVVAEYFDINKDLAETEAVRKILLEAKLPAPTAEPGSSKKPPARTRSERGEPPRKDPVSKAGNGANGKN